MYLRINTVRKCQHYISLSTSFSTSSGGKYTRAEFARNPRIRAGFVYEFLRSNGLMLSRRAILQWITMD